MSLQSLCRYHNPSWFTIYTVTHIHTALDEESASCSLSSSSFYSFAVLVLFFFFCILLLTGCFRSYLQPVGIYPKKYEWAGTPLHLQGIHSPNLGGDCSLMVRAATIDFDDGAWECQVTASDFTTQDALTSEPVQLVVRGELKLIHTFTYIVGRTCKITNNNFNLRWVRRFSIPSHCWRIGLDFSFKSNHIQSIFLVLLDFKSMDFCTASNSCQRIHMTDISWALK